MTDLTAYPEREWFARMANDEEPAFRVLFETYREKLFTFVYKLVPSAADTEEIVQDVFLKLWQNRHTLGDVEHPRQYIYTMCRNRSFDFLAKVARDRKLQQQLWSQIRNERLPIEEWLQEKETSTLLKEALQLLPDKKQKVFRMSREAGMTHEEIAAQLGLSRSTVKNIITEVSRYLRHYLADNGDTAILISILSYYLLP